MSDAKVLFDYDAEADDELTLKEGDLIRNIEKKEDGWWEGELYGRRGMFPENFVEEIKKQAPVAAKEIMEEKSQEKIAAFNEKTIIAKVTFDYDAENDDELTLKEGEMVKVLDQEEEGWWKGELNGKIGVFPTNFVEVVKTPVQVSSALPREEPVEEKGPEKKTPKSIGGIGFGDLLTRDALSGIKLKTRNNNTKLPPKKEKPVEGDNSELSKKLSLKRNPPGIPQPARPSKQSNVKEKASAEHDYDAEHADELTLRKGDIINILEKGVTEGWWKGELNGKVGLFPDNFVKLLPPEVKKEPEPAKDKVPTEMPIKIPPSSHDAVDNKPNRPELPKTKPTELKPPVPGSKPSEEIIKKQEAQASESKPVQEEKPARPPINKTPPLLPKKPDKPKPLLEIPNKEHQVELRNRNGPNIDPSKRFSEMPQREVIRDTPKRHSSGADIPLNLNDIKSASVLQPLTHDRPKNLAKNLPTKYGQRPSSPKKASTPEKINNTEWPKEAKESPKPAHIEKPRKPSIPETAKPTVPEASKPALPEGSKPKTNEATTVSPGVAKKLQNEINTLKNSLESMVNEFKEHIGKSEKRFKAMEKKLSDEIDEITRELDEEKKASSALQVEVQRLRKLIKHQPSS